MWIRWQTIGLLMRERIRWAFGYGLYRIKHRLQYRELLGRVSFSLAFCCCYCCLFRRSRLGVKVNSKDSMKEIRSS